LKQGIIGKTILILGVAIVAIFFSTGYIFFEKNKELIDEIRQYNLSQAMDALDKQQTRRLATNQKLIEDSVDMIAKNSSPFLLNYDQDGLKQSLIFDIKKEGVKAIEVFDTVANEQFLLAVKKKDQILFEDTLPSSFQNYIKFQRDIVLSNSDDIIGKITFYYDDSIIKDQIKQLKIDTTSKIDSFNSTIDKKMVQANINKLIIAIVSLVIILALISFLLIKFVNNPLNILKDGLDDFFLFLQNKKDNTQKIDINSNDEFGSMAKSLNENISVSAKLHEEIHELNTNLESKVQEKTKKVTTLLNNAGQGFLTFGENFKIDNEYSKECEKLLGTNIASKDISHLLFKDIHKKEIFKTSLLNAIKETNALKKSSYLSLLPSIILLNKKAVKLEYKIIEDNKFMMILTNITSQKKLEKKIKKEQEILKMIVAIVSESEVFYELKSDYSDFINSYKNSIDTDKTALHNISETYRAIHTFKGTFAQLYIQDVVNFLHEVESDISSLQKDLDHTTSDLLELLDSYDFKSSLNQSMNIIKEILGDEFLESDNYLKVDITDISTLQKKIQNVLQNHQSSPECHDILCAVQNLSSQKLVSLLQPYISLSLQLAQRLEKELYDFEIVGDRTVVVPDNFKPFIKSLVHIFRNCVDHGLEDPETRVENGKDEKGTISCSFSKDDDNLQIIIADDGAGLDLEKIKQKAIDNKIDISSLDKNGIFNLIFEDNFSTSQSISNISGRGVGLAAVKNDIEKLNGNIEIKSQKNIGTTFIFTIPIDN